MGLAFEGFIIVEGENKMGNFKITINPLFLMEGIICFLLGFGDIWVFCVGCSLFIELGQAYFTINSEITKFCIHFTPISIKVEDVLPVFSKKLYRHFIGTGISLLVSFLCLGLELYNYASCAFVLAFVRMFPLLPFEGGKLLLNALGNWFGTIKVATLLTKIGAGCGYGIFIFGVMITGSYEMGWICFPIGAYLVYCNNKILYPITKKLYQGLAVTGEKPIKEVTVRGTETPVELSFYLNPYEEIFFYAKGMRGVSQQKVIVGILEKEDASWLWTRKQKI